MTKVKNLKVDYLYALQSQTSQIGGYVLDTQVSDPSKLICVFRHPTEPVYVGVWPDGTTKYLSDYEVVEMRAKCAVPESVTLSFEQDVIVSAFTRLARHNPQKPAIENILTQLTTFFTLGLTHITALPLTPEAAASVEPSVGTTLRIDAPQSNRQIRIEINVYNEPKA